MSINDDDPLDIGRSLMINKPTINTQRDESEPNYDKLPSQYKDSVEYLKKYKEDKNNERRNKKNIQENAERERTEKIKAEEQKKIEAYNGETNDILKNDPSAYLSDPNAGLIGNLQNEQKYGTKESQYNLDSLQQDINNNTIQHAKGNLGEDIYNSFTGDMSAKLSHEAYWLGKKYLQFGDEPTITPTEFDNHPAKDFFDRNDDAVTKSLMDDYWAKHTAYQDMLQRNEYGYGSSAGNRIARVGEFVTDMGIVLLGTYALVPGIALGGAAISAIGRNALMRGIIGTASQAELTTYVNLLSKVSPQVAVLGLKYNKQATALAHKVLSLGENMGAKTVAGYNLGVGAKILGKKGLEFGLVGAGIEKGTNSFFKNYHKGTGLLDPGEYSFWHSFLTNAIEGVPIDYAFRGVFKGLGYASNKLFKTTFDTKFKEFSNFKNKAEFEKYKESLEPKFELGEQNSINPKEFHDLMTPTETGELLEATKNGNAKKVEEIMSNLNNPETLKARLKDKLDLEDINQTNLRKYVKDISDKNIQQVLKDEMIKNKSFEVFDNHSLPLFKNKDGKLTHYDYRPKNLDYQELKYLLPENFKISHENVLRIADDLISLKQQIELAKGSNKDIAEFVNQNIGDKLKSLFIEIEEKSVAKEHQDMLATLIQNKDAYQSYKDIFELMNKPLEGNSIWTMKPSKFDAELLNARALEYKISDLKEYKDKWQKYMEEFSPKEKELSNAIEGLLEAQKNLHEIQSLLNNPLSKNYVGKKVLEGYKEEQFAEMKKNQDIIDNIQTKEQELINKNEQIRDEAIQDFKEKQSEIYDKEIGDIDISSNKVKDKIKNFIDCVANFGKELVK